VDADFMLDLLWFVLGPVALGVSAFVVLSWWGAAFGEHVLTVLRSYDEAPRADDAERWEPDVTERWELGRRRASARRSLVGGGLALGCCALLGLFGSGLAVALSNLPWSDDGDTVIIGWEWGSHSDAFPASSIASNNLAPDGGGMSPNGASVSEVRVVWACDEPTSDGPGTPSNDALVVFTTVDPDGVRLYATHFDGSSFTPPTRLYAAGRDLSQPVYPSRFSVLALQPGPDAIEAERNHTGDWVLVGDVPIRARASSPAQRALVQWTFRPELRGLGEHTEVDEAGGWTTHVNGFLTEGVLLDAPGDVTSYGLISDGFAGPVRYPDGVGAAQHELGSVLPRFERVPGPASAQPGEHTTVVGLFHTQSATSSSEVALSYRAFDPTSLRFGAPQTLPTPEPDCRWRPGIVGSNGWAFLRTERTRGSLAEGLVAFALQPPGLGAAPPLPAGSAASPPLFPSPGVALPSPADGETPLPPSARLSEPLVLRPAAPGRVTLDPAGPWLFGPDQGLAETVAFWAADDPDTGVPGLYAARLEQTPAGASWAPGGAPRRLSQAHAPLLPREGRPFRAQINRAGSWIAVAYAEARQRGDDEYAALSALAYRCRRAGAPADPRCFGPPRALTAERIPLSDYAWQGGAGYRGFQSDLERLHLLWEQSFDRADRLFVAGLEVSLDPPDVRATPVAELGDGFLEGEVELERSVQSCDDPGGVLVLHSQATEVGQQVFLSRYADDGFTATPISIGAAPPGDPLARRLGGLLPPGALVTTPRCPDSEGFGVSPAAVYVYLYGAAATEDTDYGALYTRKIDAPYDVLAANMSARVDAFRRWSFGLPWAPPGPVRLSGEGGAVDSVATIQNGSSVLVLWEQDRHVWSRETYNGFFYTPRNGKPNLVDNDTSEDLAWFRLIGMPARGDAQAFLVLLAKWDSDDDLRLRLRAGSSF